MKITGVGENSSVQDFRMYFSNTYVELNKKPAYVQISHELPEEEDYIRVWYRPFNLRTKATCFTPKAFLAQVTSTHPIPFKTWGIAKMWNKSSMVYLARNPIRRAQIGVNSMNLAGLFTDEELEWHIKRAPLGGEQVKTLVSSWKCIPKKFCVASFVVVPGKKVVLSPWGVIGEEVGEFQIKLHEHFARVAPRFDNSQWRVV